MGKKVNEQNVAELEQQKANTKELIGIGQPEYPTWQAFQECQIRLPLGWLLQLVPHFTEGLKTGITAGDTPLALAFFSNPEEGPTIVDTNSLAITAIVKGKELLGTIIDGGSGVNV